MSKARCASCADGRKPVILQMSRNLATQTREASLHSSCLGTVGDEKLKAGLNTGSKET